MFKHIHTIKRLLKSKITTAILLFFFLISLFPIIVPQKALASSWYDTDWDYRREITIDHTKVNNVAAPATTYANLPILINISGLSNINANGTDIRFTSSDGVTLLPREIEKYDSGTLDAWVKITLTKDAGDSTDDVIYMYYGNSDATEPAADSDYGSKKVWNNNNAVGVWHLDESPANDVAGHLDSTPNTNNGTPKNFSGTPNGTPSATSTTDPATDVATWSTDKKIDGADVFDGTDDYVDVGSITFSDDFTIAAWIKVPSSWAQDYPAIIGPWNSSGPKFIRLFARYADQSDKVYFHKRVPGNIQVYSTSALSQGWHFLAVVYEVGQDVALYIDGVLNNTGTECASDTFTETTPLGRDGYDGSGSENQYFNGTIDEVSIWDAGLSPDWIATSYNNQKYPDKDDYPDDGFYTVESEEVGNTAPNTPTTDNYNDGSQTNNDSPTLQFDMSDPDSGDIIKYQIQVDDNSDFSSPFVDITESSGSSEPRNDVQYNLANLGDDSYYWRVRVIDDNNAESSWSTANNGGVAFVVDTVERNVGAPGCTSDDPGSAPVIISATEIKYNSLTLNFNQAQDPVEYYVLEYGEDEGIYIFSADNIGNKESNSYTVGALVSGKKYYFRIRASNGCATGPWSNVFSATTNWGTSLFEINKLDTEIVDVETKSLEGGQCSPYTVKTGDSLWKITEEQLDTLVEYDEIIELNKDKYPSLITNPEDLNIGWELNIPCENEETSEKKEALGHTVKVKVIDEDDNKVEGAKVTLFSEPKITYTDNNGVAAFKNVESGEHKVEIEYDNKKGEQNIVLGAEDTQGEFQEISLTIKIAEQNPFLSPYVIIVISVLIIGIILLTYKNLKKKNSS